MEESERKKVVEVYMWRKEMIEPGLERGREGICNITYT